MRTRSTSTTVAIPPGQYYQDQFNSNTGAFIRRTGPSSSPAYTYSSPFGSSEIISDEQVKMKRYGWCSHSVERMVSYDRSITAEWTWAPDRFVENLSGGYWQYNYIRPHLASWLTGPVITLRSFDWEQGSYDAMLKMKPRFSDASFFNDVLELGQIASLINPLGLKGATRVAGKRNVSRDGSDSSTSSSHKGTIAGVDGASPIGRAITRLQGGANMHLWYQFGAKPAYQSAQEVIRLLKQLPDIIQKLRNQQEHVQTRHYSRPIDTLSLPGDTSFQVGALDVHVSTRVVSAPKYTASLRYRLDLSRFSDFELKLRAWAQAFGLNSPLKIAWNAIPMSFVVDWFADVGKWLGSLVSPDAIPIIVEDFCHSTKVEYTTRAVVDHSFGVPGHTVKVSGLLAGEKTTKLYDRRRAIPSTTSRVGLNLPSVGQVFTLAALGAQRLPKRKPFRPPPALRWLKFSHRVMVRK